MAVTTTSRFSVLIVGAGAAGIGAGRWLLNNGAGIQKRTGLLCNDVDVIVLEARNRSGGRVFTYSNETTSNCSGGLSDLGASWIHDPYRNPLTIMALKLDIKLVETDFEESLVTDLEGKRICESDLDKQDKIFERVLFKEAAQARRKNLHAKSLEDTLCSKLDTSSPIIQQLLSEIEFELGCPLRDCSACECIDGDWIGAMNDGSNEAFRRLPKNYQSCNDLVLPGGYGALFAAMESGAALDGTELQHSTLDEDGGVLRIPMDIRFNEEVVSIDQDSVPGKAVVTAKRYACPFVDPVHDSALPKENPPVKDVAALTATEVNAKGSVGGAIYSGRADMGAQFETVQYTVDAVIVTAPIGVLQAGCIAFTPPLSPAKQAAIDSTGSGNVVKVVVEFAQVFWPTHAPLLCIADPALADPEHRGLLTYFLNGHKVAGKKVLVGYGLGDAAAVIDQMSDEEVQALVMSRMRALALPGRTVPAAPLRIVRSRWSQDPYARGVYSCWKPGNLPGMRRELSRPEGCVWFAGEAVQESSLLSSSVHGAWLSGIEQAAAVCAHIGVPCSLPVAFNRERRL